MEKEAIRTYQLLHAANSEKINQVAAILKPYQDTVRSMQSWQMKRFFLGEGFYNRANPRNIPSRLSERYKRSCLNQTVAGLSSWEEICKEHFVSYVTHSTLPQDLKIELYRINKIGFWYHKEVRLLQLDEVGKKTEGTHIVSGETMALTRQIMKQIKKRKNRLPDLCRSNTMLLDGPVAQVEKSRTGRFAYWVRISTLTKGKPVRIPLTTHRYFNEAPGVVRNFCQVRVGRDGQVTFSLIKGFPKAEPRKEGEPLGLDFGLSTLFATSSGDLLGRRLYPWLKERDTELTILTKNLQRQGIKPSTSKRYRRFQYRIKAHVENEVSRCLNRAVAPYTPQSLVLEKLDFRGGGLSSRLNRILSRAGRAAVKRKLKALEETRGITSNLVNPAYTSRECSSCFYTSKINRQGEKFSCKHCCKKINADVNGAQIVKKRFLDGDSWLYVSKDQILQSLDRAFEERWRVSFSQIASAKPRSKPTPKCRPASSLLSGRSSGMKLAQLQTVS